MKWSYHGEDIDVWTSCYISWHCRGAEPPHDPTRLPAPCKSSAAAPKYKGREKVKLLGVARKVPPKGKLNVEFDHAGQTWKAIGDNSPWYDSTIGVHTRDVLEPFHDTWKQVDANSKKLIRSG
ncbi:hypothetical protein TIFTF001_034305 [Ficus carica]|uniref:Uncharacterized protein n=1 Tax=Ficus carica TaxID=3494 RepID=A0AA88J8D3_FICCA|nr:hypothetical protein TIFTF001_034305 [Ficus carica]